MFKTYISDLSYGPKIMLHKQIFMLSEWEYIQLIATQESFILNMLLINHVKKFIDVINGVWNESLLQYTSYKDMLTKFDTL